MPPSCGQTAVPLSRPLDDHVGARMPRRARSSAHNELHSHEKALLEVRRQHDRVDQSFVVSLSPPRPAVAVSPTGSQAAGEVFGLYGTPTPIDVVRLLSLAECQSRSKHHEAGSDTGGEGDACSRRRLSLEERSSMQIQYSQSGRTITGGGPVGNGAADGTAADKSSMTTVWC